MYMYNYMKRCAVHDITPYIRCYGTTRPLISFAYCTKRCKKADDGQLFGETSVNPGRAVLRVANSTIQ